MRWTSCWSTTMTHTKTSRFAEMMKRVKKQGSGLSPHQMSKSEPTFPTVPFSPPRLFGERCYWPEETCAKHSSDYCISRHPTAYSALSAMRTNRICLSCAIQSNASVLFPSLRNGSPENAPLSPHSNHVVAFIAPSLDPQWFGQNPTFDQSCFFYGAAHLLWGLNLQLALQERYDARFSHPS